MNLCRIGVGKRKYWVYNRKRMNHTAARENAGGRFDGGTRYG
jgi:hypothetical protein